MEMKKLILILAAIVAVCGIVYAAQNTALSNADVRDPRYLETWLENNASDAESRLAGAEAGSGITALSAAKLTAGTIASAIAGQSITNIGAANIKAGGSISAINGAAITNIVAANIAGTKYSGTVTNGPAGTTNVMVILNGLVQSVTLNP